jgi:Tol biopolymer transport system component
MLWKLRKDASADAHRSDDAAVTEQGAQDAATHDKTSSADAGTGCSWSGTLNFESPTPLTALNSPSHELEPCLSPDGLTIYFASNRDGTWDVFQATRSSRTEAFSSVEKNLEVSTDTDAETRFALSKDGLEAFLATDRPGGAGGSDIWRATRSSTTTPFSPADFKPVAALSSSANEWDPYPSADGLRLYYVIHDWVDGMGGTEIVVAARSDPQAAFSAPAAVQGVNSSVVDDNPAVTADERVIVFSSERPGGQGDKDIWYAVSASDTDDFSSPKPVPAVNSANDDSELYITPDGCELYFASDRPGGQGAGDLYYTRLIP